LIIEQLDEGWTVAVAVIDGKTGSKWRDRFFTSRAVLVNRLCKNGVRRHCAFERAWCKQFCFTSIDPGFCRFFRTQSLGSTNNDSAFLLPQDLTGITR
jgi:hypothetical protein